MVRGQTEEGFMRKFVELSMDAAPLGVIGEPRGQSFHSANGGHYGSRRPTGKVAG